MAMSTAGQVILEEDQIVPTATESLLTTDEMEVDRPVVKHIGGNTVENQQQLSGQQATEQIDTAA